MIIIRNQKLSDLICNLFYKFRYWTYRKFFQSKLSYISSSDKKGWETTFEDNFSKESWTRVGDKDHWQVGNGWTNFHPGSPNQWYGPPILEGLRNSALFVAHYNPRNYEFKGESFYNPFEVSWINTSVCLKQKYGRFECRMNVPYVRGAWPAFWMFGDTWPPEIDFEFYGKEDGMSSGIAKINLHYGIVEQGNKEDMRAWGVKFEDWNDHRRMHEFAVEWYPHKIEFFINGIKVFRYTRKDILDKWFNTSNGMWIVVNNGIESSKVSDNEKDYYSEFYVDYVRAYKKNITWKNL